MATVVAKKTESTGKKGAKWIITILLVLVVLPLAWKSIKKVFVWLKSKTAKKKEILSFTPQVVPQTN